MPAKKIAKTEVVTEAVEPVKKKRTYIRKKKVAEQPLSEGTSFITEHVSAQPSTPSGPIHLSIIIPAYNEAERIVPTLIEAHAFGMGRNQPFEIIVVDDGSTDRTAEIVTRLSQDLPQVRVLAMEHNSGKGAAVAKGMLAAVAGLRLFADADGSTPFDEFSKLEDALGMGADLTFGSRALPESVVNPAQPWVRVVLGRMSNLMIQATNLPGIWDTQCGFKLCTAKAAEAIFPHMQVSRWGFDIEMLVLAKRLGLVIKEVPVTWRDRAGSLLRPGAYLQTLGENLRIRYNALTGAYPRK